MEDFIIIAAIISVPIALAVIILKAKDKIFNKRKNSNNKDQTSNMDLFLELGAPSLGNEATSIVITASRFLAAKTEFMTESHLKELDIDQEKKKYFLGYCAGIPFGFIHFGDVDVEREKTFTITLWVFKLFFGIPNGDDFSSPSLNSMMKKMQTLYPAGWIVRRKSKILSSKRKPDFVVKTEISIRKTRHKT